MKLSVNAAALPGLAALMDRRWEDLNEGRDYLIRNTRIVAGEAGILNWIWGQHEKIVAATGDFLGTAADGYAAPYGHAVLEAAAYYRYTDAQAAARLDASLTPVDDPGKHDGGLARSDPSLDSATFTDRMCPGDRYAQPADHHVEAPYTFGALDTLSPTSEVRELVWQVSQIAVDLGLLDRPYDVIEEAVKPFSGDWAAFAGCADTFQHIAEALNDASDCVVGGVTTIPRVWVGNAADRCAMGLTRFAADLGAAVDPLLATAEAYSSTAEQVRAHAEVLAALLTILIDEVIEAALDALSGGVLEVFQVATTVEDTVQTVLKMRRVVAAAWDLARSFVESGSVSTASLGILRDNHPLPTLVADLPTLPHLPRSTDPLTQGTGS
jgi:hypothetical protein